MTDLLHTDKFEPRDHQDPILGDAISQIRMTIYYDQMSCMYTVGAEYIEAPQLKLLKLVPYRKYPANTVSRVSKLATFFMVNTRSAESPLSAFIQFLGFLQWTKCITIPPRHQA